MSDDTRKPVLDDHVKVKKKLVSPLMNSLGERLSQYSWTKQIAPQLIWIALLIDRYGYQKGVNLSLELVKASADESNAVESPLFAKFSAFVRLNGDEKGRIIKAIGLSELNEICEALEPLSALINSHPLYFLNEGRAEKHELGERLPLVLRDFYDRNSRIAVLSMATVYYLGIKQGKIHVAQHMMDDLIYSFEKIDRYPDTEDSQRVAGRFRAAAPMFIMGPKGEDQDSTDDDAWVSLFWEKIAGFGPCLDLDTLKDIVVESDDEMDVFVISFQNAARADLRARLQRWPLDLKEIEAYEVVAALLSRQTTLAIELSMAPAIWNPHTAPLMLRAMADVFISLAWILKNPGPRSKQYIEDGLGAIKLEIAHRKRELEKLTDQDDIDHMKYMIELWSDWLKSQRMDQFVEVNLGSWSGLNTRKMAEEAGFIDFYNYVYRPFSSVVHSNWAHVSMFNTEHCQNPAHSLHRTPAIMPVQADPHWLYLATKYLSKTLNHFDEMNGLNDLPHNAFDFIESWLVRADDPE